MMTHSRMKRPKVSDVITEQIGAMIIEGGLKPGAKLPPERKLAEQLQTSRPTLRAALQQLETQGFIYRVQGGGNYVADKVESSFADPLLALYQNRDEFKYDLLEYRHALEEATCYLAAQRATPADKEIIQQRYDEWLTLHRENRESDIEAEADLAFHLSIAEASHNVVLPHAMRSSLTLVEHSVTRNLKELYADDSRRALIRQQHEAMLNAILESNAEASRAAVKEHLSYVKDSLEEMDIHKLRNERTQAIKAVLNRA